MTTICKIWSVLPFNKMVEWWTVRNSFEFFYTTLVAAVLLASVWAIFQLSTFLSTFTNI